MFRSLAKASDSVMKLSDLDSLVDANPFLASLLAALNNIVENVASAIFLRSSPLESDGVLGSGDNRWFTGHAWHSERVLGNNSMRLQSRRNAVLVDRKDTSDVLGSLDQLLDGSSHKLTVIIDSNPAETRSLTSLNNIVSNLGSTIAFRQGPVDDEFSSHNSRIVNRSLRLIRTVKNLDIDIFANLTALVSGNNLVLSSIALVAVLDSESAHLVVTINYSTVTIFNLGAVSIPEDLWLGSSDDSSLQSNIVTGTDSEAVGQEGSIQLNGWRLHLFFALKWLSWFSWSTDGSHSVLSNDTENVGIRWSKSRNGVLALSDIVVVATEPSAIWQVSSLNDVLRNL